MSAIAQPALIIDSVSRGIEVPEGPEIIVDRSAKVELPDWLVDPSGFSMNSTVPGRYRTSQVAMQPLLTGAANCGSVRDRLSGMLLLNLADAREIARLKPEDLDLGTFRRFFFFGTTGQRDPEKKGGRGRGHLFTPFLEVIDRMFQISWRWHQDPWVLGEDAVAHLVTDSR